MEQPTPRVALGLALRGVASAGADISDGLLGDLGHILERSGLGATVNTTVATTLLAAHADYAGSVGRFDREIGSLRARQCVLVGGDDYELVFTAAPAQRAQVETAARSCQVPVTRIGTMDSTPGLRLVDDHGATVNNTFVSFDHFVT
jgi:thiamine-monophosphate kinase